MAFLNYNGLKRYDKKTKEYIKDKISEASLNGGTVDLTGYAKTVDVNASLNTKVDKVDGKSLILDAEIARLATINNYDDTAIKQTINTKANTTDLTTHTDDNTIHITSTERTKWNNKLDNADLTNYATKTYVTDEIAKASTITDNRYNEIVNYIFGGE